MFQYLTVGLTLVTLVAAQSPFDGCAQPDMNALPCCEIEMAAGFAQVQNWSSALSAGDFSQPCDPVIAGVQTLQTCLDNNSTCKTTWNATNVGALDCSKNGIQQFCTWGQQFTACTTTCNFNVTRFSSGNVTASDLACLIYAPECNVAGNLLFAAIQQGLTSTLQFLQAGCPGFNNNTRADFESSYNFCTAQQAACANFNPGNMASPPCCQSIFSDTVTSASACFGNLTESCCASNLTAIQSAMTCISGNTTCSSSAEGNATLAGLDCMWYGMGVACQQNTNYTVPPRASQQQPPSAAAALSPIAGLLFFYFLW